MLQPPMIIAQVLPSEEQEYADHIHGNLTHLDNCVRKLRSAVALFDYAQSEQKPAVPIEPTPGGFDREAHERWMEHNNQMRDWCLMAARSGALLIYEFNRLQQAIDGMLPHCPTLNAMIDEDARKRGNKAFQTAFPDFAAIRLFAAHGSEIFDSPDKAKKHAIKNVTSLPFPNEIKGNIANLVIGDTLNGRDYINTVDGRVVSYCIARDIVDALQAVLAARFQTFEPAERATRDLFRERRSEELRRTREGNSHRP